MNNNSLLDTFTVDYLLSKLSSPDVKVFVCMSPIDLTGLPFFLNYLKRPEKQSVCVIPLCDGAHFQGYVADIKNKTIIHVDSLSNRPPENSTSLKIANILFDVEHIKYSSLFESRRQFDSSSCGTWLSAGIASYILNLPLPTKRSEAFEIAYGLLPSRESLKPEESAFPPDYSTADIIDRFTTAEFLINTLLNEPHKGEFFRERPIRGLKTNFFYIVDISKNPLHTVNADDNGAYTQTRNTTKHFYHADNTIHIVHKEGDRFYYNKRYAYNKYEKIFVADHDIVALHRRYCKAKSFPLKRTIITLSHPSNGPVVPYAAVLYQTDSTITEDSRILCHGNTKEQNQNRPYVRTSPDVLAKAKEMLKQGTSTKETYDTINSLSGGVYSSTSQSNELRDLKQVYRAKEEIKDRTTNTNTDELNALIRYQREHSELLRTVACLAGSYYCFIGDDIQLNDVVQFCCAGDSVLSIDTTFNLCKNWLTDSCYQNLRLENLNGNHPIFLGPCILHFKRDAFLFSRFLKEMSSFNMQIMSLKTIGTDMDRAIFNGFSRDILELKLLICALHLEKADKQKLGQFQAPKSSVQKILADIYGCQYGSVKEFGLADSTNAEEFRARLESLKETWDNLCPGFHEWFRKRRGKLFEERVIESARVGTNIQGLYYNNNIESLHFKEKTEQCHKLGTTIEVIKTLGKIIDRQQDDEVRALYGNGPYKVSKDYNKFVVDTVKWHSMTSGQRQKHVAAFRSHQPTLEEQFPKPQKSGRKPSDKTRKRKPQPEVFVDRLQKNESSNEKKIRIEDPNAERNITYTLYLRSRVPRLVERCQGNCGDKLSPSDLEDYLLVKSHGPSHFTVKGEARTKFGPQYIHFNNKCLSEYARSKHGISYDKFPLSSIIVDKITADLLSDEEKNNLIDYGISFFDDKKP